MNLKLSNDRYGLFVRILLALHNINLLYRLFLFELIVICSVIWYFYIDINLVLDIVKGFYNEQRYFQLPY